MHDNFLLSIPDDLREPLSDLFNEFVKKNPTRAAGARRRRDALRSIEDPELLRVLRVARASYAGADGAFGGLGFPPDFPLVAELLAKVPASPARDELAALLGGWPRTRSEEDTYRRPTTRCSIAASLIRRGLAPDYVDPFGPQVVETPLSGPRR